MTSNTRKQRLAKFVPKKTREDKQYLQKLNHLLNRFIIENLHNFSRNEKDALIETGNLIDRTRGLK